MPTGQLETLEAVILALGQDTDTPFLRKIPGVEFKDDGTVIVTRQMMTGYPGLFAVGDIVPSKRTATIGVGHSKKAARNIDAYLRSFRNGRQVPRVIISPTGSCFRPWSPGRHIKPSDGSR